MLSPSFCNVPSSNSTVVRVYEWVMGQIACNTIPYMEVNVLTGCDNQAILNKKEFDANK